MQALAQFDTQDFFETCCTEYSPEIAFLAFIFQPVRFPRKLYLKFCSAQCLEPSAGRPEAHLHDHIDPSSSDREDLPFEF